MKRLTVFLVAMLMLLGAASGLAISRFEQKKGAEKDGAV